MFANVKRSLVGVVGALVLGMVCIGAATGPAQASITIDQLA